MPDDKYKYFAFICYTHVDYKEARLLHKKLQSFSLPNKLTRRNHEPKRLKPVFLDHDDMLSNPYKEEDVSALQNSKFLIVVCSRNLNAHDENVNAEIRDFLESGHSFREIIPYIIDDSDRPEVNCFPAELRRINDENNINIIGHSIYNPSGSVDRRQAQIKTIAKMHGIDAFELDNEDHRRRLKLILLRVFSFFLIALLTIGFYAYISFNTFPFKIKLSERLEGEKVWQDEIMDADIGDVVQFQIEFVNNRGFMTEFLTKFAENNCLKISSDDIMIRVVLPTNMEYIDGSTVLYNAHYQDGVKVVENTVVTKGINIGSYYINGNSYIRFCCKIKDENLQSGVNELVTWGAATIWSTDVENEEKYIHQKDSVSIILNKD